MNLTLDDIFSKNKFRKDLAILFAPGKEHVSRKFFAILISGEIGFDVHSSMYFDQTSRGASPSKVCR